MRGEDPLTVSVCVSDCECVCVWDEDEAVGRRGAGSQGVGGDVGREGDLSTHLK